MRRTLLRMAVAASLLLCVATLALWVRSYFASDRVTWRTDQVDPRDGSPWTYSEAELKSSRGWLSYRYYNQHGRPGDLNFYFRERLAHCVSHHAVQWERTAPASSIQLWASRFGSETPLPHWSLATIFSVLPFGRACTWWMRQRRENTGHCTTCGYDLRATPDRCPECGAAPKPTPAAA